MLCTMMLVNFGGCQSSQQGADTASESGSGAQTDGEENIFAYEDESETAPISETIMGMVQSVEGNQFTLSVGDGHFGKGPSGDKPDGEAPNGEAPEDGGVSAKDGGMAEGKTAVLTLVDASVLSSSESDSVSLDDITEGTMLKITFDENGAITAVEVGGKGGQGGEGKPGEQAAGVESYDAVTEYTEDTEVENESFTSSGVDENAIHVSAGANVKLDSITLDRASEESTGGDTSSFYGVGAGLLATDGTVTVKNSTITTDAAGGTGIFAYGSGTVYVSDTKISTGQDTSGGIHAAGGGALYAWDLDVTTEGESSAAIRSDRGGGTMVVEGGSYTSNGVGSPAVYCTADIAVKDAALTASGSEAVCMEGLNSIHLFDCDISGNMSDDPQNDTTWDIIVYQSMSGDAEVGTSTMQIVGGSLTSQNGGLIYTTNTQSNILLSDVDITYAKDSEFFLQCTGNKNQRGWGAEGSNGAQCIFTADEQEMEGNVIWDSISQLDFTW